MDNYGMRSPDIFRQGGKPGLLLSFRPVLPYPMTQQVRGRRNETVVSLSLP